MMSQPKGKLKHKEVTVEGLTLFYRLSSMPIPQYTQDIVIVHGLAVPAHMLIPLAERLSPFYRVFIPDLPGFGKSAKPAHILNLAELADSLHHWMQAIALEQAIFIGSSSGCQVIAQLAERHPERIDRVVLIGPTTDPQARVLRKELPRWFRSMIRRPLSLCGLFCHYQKAGFSRTGRTLQYTLQDKIEDHLPSLQAPTLVVRGSRDPVVSERWAEQVERILPRAQLAIIAGATHNVVYDAPDELVHVICSFLALDWREVDAFSTVAAF